jgi:hypothetical protein
MSAFGGKADIIQTRVNVCFSNRPVGVKRFQAIRHCGVDVARGLVLLSGLGARALPSWDPRTRWNNLLSGLSVKRTIGAIFIAQALSHDHFAERSSMTWAAS